MRDEDGKLLLGDDLMADWRARTATGTTRLRCYYDVIPDRDSRVDLDPSRRNRFGDPLPTLHFQDAPVSRDLRQATEDRIRGVFDGLVRSGNGRILRTSVDEVQDHPGGGCRMSDDPGEGVVDAWGRAHDHENLFVVGAPTMVSGGCSNGTLTFAALSLRSAEAIGRDFPSRST